MDIRAKEADVTRAGTIRLYLIICGTTNLTMHMIYRMTVPDVWDPLFERMCLAAIFYAGVAATLAVEPRKQAQVSAACMIIASVCESLWLARGLYQNQLKMEFTLGAHTAFYVFFFFQSSKLGLYIYTIVGLTAFTLATFLVPHPAMSPILATGLVSAAPLFAWAVHGKISMEKRLVELQLELAMLAYKDSLTGLYNRRALLEEFSREISRAGRMSRTFAVVILDLDYFKNTNDTHGHAAGDRLLQMVAQALSAKLRVEDFICRFGGEEFVVLVTGIDYPDIPEQVERLLQSLRQIQLPYEGKVITTTASAGVAVFPQDGTTADLLLSCADVALYRAKAQGRNRFELSNTLRERLEPQKTVPGVLKPA